MDDLIFNNRITQRVIQKLERIRPLTLPKTPIRAFVKGQWVNCSDGIQGTITGEQKKQKNYLGTSFKVQINGRVKHVRKAYHCFK